MKSRWDEQEARKFSGDLGLRVYTSRLLGREPSLVLHGGGNTSVKIREPDLFGDEEEILYVKGSGWDLASIEETGFSPVKLDHLRRMADLPSLSDPDMVNELRANLKRASAPTPSVEAILHAILPYRFVDHTHADAVIAITNTNEGRERIQSLYGDSVVVVPYVMPGFDLARRCHQLFSARAHDGTMGIVLMNHGLFSFGDTARESYERMIELVSRAETYLSGRGAGPRTFEEEADPDATLRIDLAELRGRLAEAAGAPVILSCHRDPDCLAFVRRADLGEVAMQGPITPDHVIRTKRVPMIGRDVDEYANRYREYFRAAASTHARELVMLDPAPRVVLDPGLGLCTVGRDVRESSIVRDLYRHTMKVIDQATRLGGYRALPAADVFAVEYWDLEQAKLARTTEQPLFRGEIGLVTGAASGIGRATVRSLLDRGAAVVGLDVEPSVRGLHSLPGYLGIRCDVTDLAQVSRGLETAVRRFGGLDILILSAGIFPESASVESMDDALWRRVMKVNVDANLALLRAAFPLLALAPRKGRVVVIGSKNVAAPGPGAAAYSASKAALTQLARVAALEWGRSGIRINTLHPNAVFDTGMWTEEIMRSRAEHYGMTIEEYRKNNVLGVDISSRDVAELAAEMCGPLFAKTTAAQVPVDGGDVRVI